MADFGIKTSEEGKDISSTNLDDMTFDSRYSSLMLLEKKVLTWSVAQGETNPTGTQTYTHNLGYFAFTLAYADFTTQSEEFTDKFIPYSYTFPTRGGTDMYVDLTCSILENSIEIHWVVEEYDSGMPVALTDDVDFTVTLHIYAYELGYKTE